MFWGLGFLWPIVLFGRFFWLLIVLLLVFALLRRFRVKRGRFAFGEYRGFPHPGPSPAPFSAMEILRQRYARGEIDATTFDQMRERLEASERPHQQS
jgi:putative membrane protein